MITLYYKDNVSDKVYQASVEPSSEPGLYDVNFAYGRRGNTLTTGKKNSAPISKEAADKMLEKLVREKMAKGYTPGKGGVAYSNTSQEERFTGILPMLLNPITEEELPKYLKDDNWVAQEKYDGKRMLIRKHDDIVYAINRKGLIVGAPENVLSVVRSMPGNFILDGETIGDVYIVFDQIVPNMPLYDRLEAIKAMSFADSNIRFAGFPYPTLYQDKKLYMNNLRYNNYEGIVFKDLRSFYTPGRPNSGGPALKHKFTATANVRVWDINVQRSVKICLKDGVRCGNVAIPENQHFPMRGDILEVRYLYAMPNSNALFQPIYSRWRDDVDEADDVSTLKYKREED